MRGYSRTDFPHWILVVLPGNNPADSSPGIIGIPLVSGNEMAVTMHNSLAGCGADIIPDIVPIRQEIILNYGFAFFNATLLSLFFPQEPGKNNLVYA